MQSGKTVGVQQRDKSNRKTQKQQQQHQQSHDPTTTWFSTLSTEDSPLTTAPGMSNWSPGANSLRCHISDDMKMVAYPGSALRDGLVSDGSLVLEMRQGRNRGDAANYDTTRNSNWNDRTSMSASKFNQGRHTAFRDYFDRPILLDNNGNLQLHHRHLSSRDEHVMSPVQRDRTLRHLEVGDIATPTHDILQQFRGLRVAETGQPGLYEVRVPNTLALVKKYTLHVVHEVDHEGNVEMKKQKLKESRAKREKHNAAIAIKVLNDAVESGRKIYGVVVKTLEDLFRVMDVENTGVIDFITFETVVARYHLGLSNDQLQALAAEFDKDGDGSIDYTEVMNTFEEGLERSRRSIDDSAVHHEDMTRYVANKKDKHKQWQQERRNSLQLAESGNSNYSLNNSDMANDASTVLGPVPVRESTLVGYYNSTENACRAYDAILIGKFGHLKSIAYMNMPESSPELWPKWQRDLYHNVTPPYLRTNMTVPRPGEPAERPETPYLQLAQNSHRLRAEWRKKRDEERMQNGMPTHLKSHFIGTNTAVAQQPKQQQQQQQQQQRHGPAIPLRPATTTPGVVSSLSCLDGALDRSQSSLGNSRSSHSNSRTLMNSSSGRGTSPQRRARYRNTNSVWVHYNKRRIKQKTVHLEKEEEKAESKESVSRSQKIVNTILNNLLFAIQSNDRSLFGHQMKSVEVRAL